jgi:hypothetical protein
MTSQAARRAMPTLAEGYWVTQPRYLRSGRNLLEAVRGKSR